MDVEPGFGRIAARLRTPVSMPRTAIAEDDVDAVLFVDGLARAIVALATGQPVDKLALQRFPGELAMGRE